MKSNKYKLVFVLIAILSSWFDSSAQEINRYILGQSSEKANYVYCFGFPQMNNADSTVMRRTKQFAITRGELLDDSTQKQKDEEVFILKTIETVKELRRKLSPNYLKEFSKALDYKTDEEVLGYFQKYKMPEDYAFFYPFLETKMALGHVLEDDKIEKGKTYIYIIRRLDINGTEEEWGYCILKAGTGNYTLDHLKAKKLDVKAYDSAVIFQWSLDVSEKAITGIPKPKYENEYERTLIEVLPYMASGLRASVYYFKNGSYIQGETILGKLNDKMDSLVFRFDQAALPNQIAAAYIRLEDEVGNMGGPSDTAFAYAVSPRFLPLLKEIDVAEIEDGIKVSWSRLPPMPFISGVLVYKINSREEIDTIGFVGVSDTSIIDYNLEVGQVYRYKAKALYADGVTFEQLVPAEGTGEYSKFSKPKVPTGLKAKTVNSHIQLDWEHAAIQSLYGFYIYRGTNPNNVSLIAGPVKENKYLDTSDALSGRSTYFYRIVAQNLRQDTSEYSEYVEITPARAIDMRAPESMEFYYENGKLHIHWLDVRIHDNAIEGFSIQRKLVDAKSPGSDNASKSGEFKTLNDSIILTTDFIDTTLLPGQEAHYRVASISFRGELGKYSEASKFSYQIKNFDVVEDFEIRNTEEGLVISLPMLETEDRAGFVIYKRKASESSMKKLTQLKKGVYEYEDKSVVDEELYVYGVTIIFKDGSEGEMGFTKSLRRSLK